MKETSHGGSGVYRRHHMKEVLYEGDITWRKWCMKETSHEGSCVYRRHHMKEVVYEGDIT
jgi:hypothetical protein